MSSSSLDNWAVRNKYTGKFNSYRASPSRNLAVVKVSSDLSTIMTKGEEESGGYYNYEGTFVE
jgi:hypothetical protein